MIEDDADTRLVLAHLLEHEGFVVATAGDGVSGLEAVRTLRPDLVLLDLLMPGLGGKEVVRVLQASPVLRDIPVVTVSASPVEHRPAQARAHLQKPFGLRELLDLVSLVLATRGGAPPTPP